MQYLVFGILSGSILAVATIGFALVRQTQGFLNIAHGQYLALGAFLGLAFVEAGVHIAAATLLTLVVVGVIGLIAAQIVFIPILDRGALPLFFTSIGLAFVIYGVMRAAFPSDVRIYPVDFGSRLTLGDVSITTLELALIAVSLATIVALHLFLTRSTLGIWIRAFASNPNLARARGLPTRWVSSVVWFLAGALGGLAGVLIGVVGSVHTELGWSYISIVLAAAVLGGVGSLYGVIAAGLLLGLAMDLSALVIPTEYRSTVAFAAIILTLLLRPEGLFSVKSRREEVFR